MIFKEIADLAEKENVVIELKIGPDKAMSIVVYGKRTEWLTIGADWENSIIVDAVKNTIRRARE